MKWSVRTRDGELVYDSFGAVEQAFKAGLIDDEDELLEEGSTKWRKAISLPLLARAKAEKKPAWQDAQLGWMVFGLVAATVSLVGLARDNYKVGLPAALLVSLVLTRVMWKAYRKSKP